MKLWRRSLIKTIAKCKVDFWNIFELNVLISELMFEALNCNVIAKNIKQKEDGFGFRIYFRDCK